VLFVPLFGPFPLSNKDTLLKKVSAVAAIAVAVEKIICIIDDIKIPYNELFILIFNFVIVLAEFDAHK